ncbi:MAG TPA: hypothetical protein DEB39_13225 [Planctomycetaceae bacterium]|nr:hypothetical protein [Planctomycetaceae bacterium]
MQKSEQPVALRSENEKNGDDDIRLTDVVNLTTNTFGKQEPRDFFYGSSNLLFDKGLQKRPPSFRGRKFLKIHLRLENTGRNELALTPSPNFCATSRHSGEAVWLRLPGMNATCANSRGDVGQ